MISSEATKSKWKQAAIAYVKLLSQHLAGETEENHEKSQSRGSPLDEDCTRINAEVILHLNAY
jgi:hypothetical protein